MTPSSLARGPRSPRLGLLCSHACASAARVGQPLRLATFLCLGAWRNAARAGATCRGFPGAFRDERDEHLREIGKGQRQHLRFTVMSLLP